MSNSEAAPIGDGPTVQLATSSVPNISDDAAFRRVLDAINDHGLKVRRRGTRSAQAQCPAHDDRNPSLSVTGIEGSVLIHCHAGCSVDDVLHALGLARSDLYDEPHPPRVGRVQAHATYRYDDGRVVVRSADKQFTQTGHTKSDSTTLFHLDRLKAAVADECTIYVVEGEKDVLAIEAVGGVATCAPMGAGKWSKVDPSPLYGGKVTVVADDDDAGHAHARDVLASLDGMCQTMRVVVANEGKDAADHIAAGHGLAAFKPIAVDELDAQRSETTPTLDPSQLDPIHVDRVAYELRVRDAARRKVAELNGPHVQPPDVIKLGDFLAVDDPETTYRVDRLWPIGGRVVLSAPYKAGKSTLVGNLLRCLADGDSLLDEYATKPARVVLIDNELDERTLRRWLRDQGIVNVDAVRLLSLRGKVSTFNLLDDDTRAEWARRIAGADVVTLDCMRPVLDALGLSEDKEAGRFLVALDALLDESGASEALVVHHMGHNGERARGDSRILDWPDALWKIVRDEPQDGAFASAVPRYFEANGRDVDVAQQQLGYEPATRRLSIVGGSRKDRKVDDALDAVIKLLTGTDQPISKNEISEAVSDSEHARADVRAAIKVGIQRGQIKQAKGGRGAHLLSIQKGNPTLDID